MSAFSDRIREQRGGGLLKVADLEGGELMYTISHLDEAVKMFKKTVDLLNFEETGRQLQLNLTTAEWLIANIGDDPETWAGKRVVLYLASFEYEGETKQGIRLKLPGTAAAAHSPDPKADRKPDRKADMDDEVPF